VKLPTKETPAEPPNPLKKLEAAMQDVRVFESFHEKVFDRHRALTEAVEVATEEVKTYCKQNKTNLSTDRMYAEFGEGKSRWYDPDATLEILKGLAIPPSSIDMVVTSVKSVDEKKLKQVAKLHNLDVSYDKEGRMKAFAAAYREETTQNRCTIKEKEEVVQ